MVNIIRFMYYKDLSLKDILSSIKEDTYSFNNFLWDEQREEIKKEVNRLQTKIEVMESYIECPRCKQKKIQFYNVQQQVIRGRVLFRIKLKKPNLKYATNLKKITKLICGYDQKKT